MFEERDNNFPGIRGIGYLSNNSLAANKEAGESLIEA